MVFLLFPQYTPSPSHRPLPCTFFFAFASYTPFPTFSSSTSLSMLPIPPCFPSDPLPLPSFFSFSLFYLFPPFMFPSSKTSSLFHYLPFSLPCIYSVHALLSVTGLPFLRSPTPWVASFPLYFPSICTLNPFLSLLLSLLSSSLFIVICLLSLTF